MGSYQENPVEMPCPNCDEVFMTLDGLLKHEKEAHVKQAITREQFREEGLHQWVLNYGQWRLLVRQADGALEIVIRAKIDQDPSLEDWERAMKTLNAFIQRERIGRTRQEPRDGELK